jgi:hypothetical protein
MTTKYQIINVNIILDDLNIRNKKAHSDTLQTYSHGCILVYIINAVYKRACKTE